MTAIKTGEKTGKNWTFVTTGGPTTDFDTAVGGTWSFVETGDSLGEDVWKTSAAHNLQEGDKIKISGGSGAGNYNNTTDYFVVDIPSATSCRLSITKGGDVVEGSSNGSNWTAKHNGSSDIWITTGTHGLSEGDAIMFIKDGDLIPLMLQPILQIKFTMS